MLREVIGPPQGSLQLDLPLPDAHQRLDDLVGQLHVRRITAEPIEQAGHCLGLVHERLQWRTAARWAEVRLDQAARVNRDGVLYLPCLCGRGSCRSDGRPPCRPASAGLVPCVPLILASLISPPPAGLSAAVSDAFQRATRGQNSGGVDILQPVPRESVPRFQRMLRLVRRGLPPRDSDCGQRRLRHDHVLHAGCQSKQPTSLMVGRSGGVIHVPVTGRGSPGPHPAPRYLHRQSKLDGHHARASATSGDIVPGHSDMVIRLDSLTAARRTQALAALCDQLTQARACYPAPCSRWAMKSNPTPGIA